MANKKIVQDVIPPKKSIRNVRIPSKSAPTVSPVSALKTSSVRLRKEIDSKPLLDDFSKVRNSEEEVVLTTEPPIFNKNHSHEPDHVEEPSTSYKYEFDEPSKKNNKKVLYFSLLILLVICGFSVSAFFKSAKVTITPKSQTATLDSDFVAEKDISDSNLSFQLVTVAKDVEKNVESTGEAKVEKKAKGTITIYNLFSSQPQKLVATTRFETPEGLIFRLVSAVTVPGSSIKAGKTVAGSVDVIVEADKSGTDYNISYKDFTLPGLKGDPKYSKIYGRSKTEMTGGFSGMQKTVSQAIIDSTEVELDAELKTDLSKDISTQIPADFVLIPSSLVYKIDPVTQANSSTGGAVLKKKGVAYGVIFNRSALSKVLLTKLIPKSAEDLVKVSNLNELNFAYTIDASDINNVNTISFNLKGEPKFVWIVDESKLKSELLGLSKKEAQSIISKYKNINEVWIETRPFWNRAIPGDPNKVTLINTLSE